jgi:hypothetical protein
MLSSLGDLYTFAGKVHTHTFLQYAGFISQHFSTLPIGGITKKLSNVTTTTTHNNNSDH